MLVLKKQISILYIWEDLRFCWQPWGQIYFFMICVPSSLLLFIFFIVACHYFHYCLCIAGAENCKKLEFEYLSLALANSRCPWGLPTRSAHCDGLTNQHRWDRGVTIHLTRWPLPPFPSCSLVLKVASESPFLLSSP